MRVIRSVLEEELSNSLRMRREYEGALKRLPKGVLIRKRIRGHGYYYLLKREGGRVRFDYLGRHISPEVAHRYKEAKQLRAKYRKLLTQVKQQVSFLEKALRGRTRRAVA